MNPLINNKKFMGLNVIQDFDEFVSSASLILANRFNQELEPFMGKIFTRDIFQEKLKLSKMQKNSLEIAVVPVAGLGTRMLPATKSIQKKCYQLLIGLLFNM